MKGYKIQKKKEKLEWLETVIQDFQKDKNRYDHPDNPKFNKYNKSYKDLIIEADSLKKQGNIKESIRKYKKAIDLTSTIFHIHSSIENKKESPHYFQRKRYFWFISIFIVILTFTLMILDLSWVVIILFIALFIMLIFAVWPLLKSG